MVAPRSARIFIRFVRTRSPRGIRRATNAMLVGLEGGLAERGPFRVFLLQGDRVQPLLLGIANGGRNSSSRWCGNYCSRSTPNICSSNSPSAYPASAGDAHATSAAAIASFFNGTLHRGAPAGCVAKSDTSDSPGVPKKPGPRRLVPPAMKLPRKFDCIAICSHVSLRASCRMAGNCNIRSSAPRGPRWLRASRLTDFGTLRRRRDPLLYI